MPRYGAKSWKPFVVSLLADLASSQALSLGGSPPSLLPLPFRLCFPLCPALLRCGKLSQVGHEGPHGGSTRLDRPLTLPSGFACGWFALRLAPDAAVHLSNQRASSPLYRQHYPSPAYSRSLNAIQWSPNEEKERLRRRLDLLYYLIRSPFFDSATR